MVLRTSVPRLQCSPGDEPPGYFYEACAAGSAAFGGFVRAATFTSRRGWMTWIVNGYDIPPKSEFRRALIQGEIILW